MLFRSYLDSFTLSSYPAPPKTLLSVMAKQLPGFGASLETAVTDLAQYQTGGFATLVLVGSEQRAINLQTLLREQKIRSAVEFRPDKLPQPVRSLSPWAVCPAVWNIPTCALPF